jgi:hypothetical protein
VQVVPELKQLREPAAITICIELGVQAWRFAANLGLKLDSIGFSVKRATNTLAPG